MILLNATGLFIATLSLISIILTDFESRKVSNLSLVFLVVGSSIFLPSRGWWVSLASVLVVALVLITLNLSLARKSKTQIQPGDFKLILILAWFFSPLNLSLILLIGASISLTLSLVLGQKKIALAGGLSLATLVIVLVRALI